MKLRDLRQGQHACLVYDDPLAALAQAAPFAARGLAEGERVVWVLGEHEPASVIAALAAAGVDSAAEQARGALVLVDKWQVSFPGGSFDPTAMIVYVRQAITDMRQAGFTNLRVVAEMTWALQMGAGHNRLIHYEALGNGLYPHEPLAALCMYDRRRHAAEVCHDALRVHPIVATPEGMVDNVFFEPPPAVAGPADAAQQLERMLSQLASLREQERRRADEERRVADDALREREQRLAGIFGAITDAFMSFDPAFRFTFANEQCERRMGRRGAELIGRDVWQLFPDAVGNIAHRELQRAMRQRVPVEYEVYYPPWQRWFFDKAYPTADGGLAVYSQDITERKRAELLRTEQSRLLEMIVEDRPARDCLHELTEAVARLHPTVRAGVSLADAKRQTMVGCVAAQLPASFGQGLRGMLVDAKPGGSCGMAIAEGRPVACEDVANDPCFSTRWREHLLGHGILACHSMPVLGAGGKAVASFMLMFAQARAPDEWESRIAEFGAHMAGIALEREHAARVLRDSEERFRAVADNISQLAWTCDTLGNVTWYNQRWLDYTGLGFDEMKGWDWSKVQHPDHLERVVARVKASAETGEPWEDTFPLRGKDGHYRWFLSRAVPIRDASGAIASWFGTNTDVTELREAQQTLRDADRRKDEFLALLAHELRNPLAPIRNAVQLLHDADGDPRIRAMARGILERQTRHTARLVDDLLDLSRITQGAISLAKRDIALTEAIEAALETSRPHLEAAGHALHVQLPDAALAVHADPVRLAQVIANLLNNAGKYTPRGGRIELEARSENGAAVVCVRDNGRGIAADMLPLVFDMFTRVQPDDHAGGLGIGLWLAKKLVELHGGSIEATSDGEGSGAAFTLRLPALGAALQPQANVRREEPDAVRRRVLVVDDNRDAAESLGLLLSEMGHEVRLAYDGREALQAACDHSPDILLLDLSMPRLDGFGVVKALRADGRHARTRVVALTGLAQESDRARVREAGFDAHLAKPVDLEALRAALRVDQAVEAAVE